MSRAAAPAVALALLLAGCSGGDEAERVNVYREAGLAGVEFVEVALAGGTDTDRRWVSINDRDDAASLAVALDFPSVPVALPACAPAYEVSFFVAGSERIDLGYVCDGEELVWGAAAGLGEGRAVAAPAEFTSQVAPYLALLAPER